MGEAGFGCGGKGEAESGQRGEVRTEDSAEGAGMEDGEAEEEEAGEGEAEVSRKGWCGMRASGWPRRKNGIDIRPRTPLTAYESGSAPTRDEGEAKSGE